MSDRESSLQAKPAGARPQDNGSTIFRVWAPYAEKVEVALGSELKRREALPRCELPGWFEGTIANVRPGDRYKYVLHETGGGTKERPDPASRHQPEGPHGPSEVMDLRYEWHDSDWHPPSLRDSFIYELHVGTFTKEGTFDAVIPKLPYLKEVGINVIELMPVAQFPGDRNWGYDGTYPFAVQDSYGGPLALKRLVDACHRQGIAVILDVVYNHMGPEGNYFNDYGPYFTDAYKTPWGSALNFDGPLSDPVRGYFVENALFWIQEFHMDGLRFDAVHAIYDNTGHHVLQEITEEVKRVTPEREVYLIAETDMNNNRYIRSEEQGGYGMGALWSDDFHHALRAVLTHERNGYYADFGLLRQVKESFDKGFVYTGQNSRYRKRRHGTSTTGLKSEQFVVFSQNHDQVGNRMLGERLTQLVSYEQLKLAAGTVLLSPFTPMLFMGEEYAESAPFQYFVSHTDPDLVRAVREGRKREFASFFHDKIEAPDPQAVETFERSKLNWDSIRKGEHGVMLSFYKELIAIARRLRSDGILSWEKVSTDLDEERGLLALSYSGHFQVHLNFSDKEQSLSDVESISWKVVIDSADERWRGPGAGEPGRIRPHSVLAVERK